MQELVCGIIVSGVIDNEMCCCTRCGWNVGGIPLHYPPDESPISDFTKKWMKNWLREMFFHRTIHHLTGWNATVVKCYSLTWWKALMTLLSSLKFCPSLSCQNSPLPLHPRVFAHSSTMNLLCWTQRQFLGTFVQSEFQLSNSLAPLAPASSSRSCSDLLGILSKIICDRPWEK